MATEQAQEDIVGRLVLGVALENRSLEVLFGVDLSVGVAGFLYLCRDWKTLLGEAAMAIEIGRMLTPLPDAEHSEANKVRGCASQVWLTTQMAPNGGDGPVLNFVGDSDAHIVRGLIAILFAMFSGKRAGDILSTDAIAVFNRLGLREHLTPQRSNGFRSMVERIRMDARAALAKPG